LPQPLPYSRIGAVDILKRARGIIEIERDALTDMAASLDESFIRAVDTILHCAGRTVITGMGKSGLVGQKISSTLASVGTPSFFVHPAEAIHGDLGMIARDDVVIAISNSGETEEIVRLLPVIKRFGLKLIAMTGKKESTLGKAADVVLNVGVKLEACPWDIVPTASTTAVLAMGDALALVLMDKKNFKREDFAVFHPGGSLGRGLFVTVEDLMHSGDKIPTVPESATMKEILREISAKKLGFTLVLGAAGALSGIVTDGDIRRIFENDATAMGKTAGQLMHKNPRTIGAKVMGGAAVKMMEDGKITSLAVVSDDGKLAGVIHLHDLLKAGVV